SRRSRTERVLYWDTGCQSGSKLFFNAGLRADIIRTLEIAPDPSAGRPRFPADTIVKANPKVALTYSVRPSTRLHTSFGTGIRPPAGLELAFTNNPHLRPERTV